jgi:hypothetical protein
MVLLPGFIDNKSATARKSWCSKFMRWNGLTIRRISHSGQKKHTELLVLRDALACKVTKLLIDHSLDAATTTPPPYTMYNMNQTDVYCDVGSMMTADFVGVSCVPAHGGGKGGYRFTAALLVCADGRMLPPRFVFAGEPDNDVYDEVQTYCEPGVTTFSVQTKAWFDERVMLEWIDKMWQYEVSEPYVLILDCLKVHKCGAVRQRLAEMGTYAVFVPAVCTSVAQPLDVGVMMPFNSSLQARYTTLYTHRHVKLGNAGMICSIAPCTRFKLSGLRLSKPRS